MSFDPVTRDLLAREAEAEAHQPDECGVPQPGRSVVCERTDEHLEHRATLSRGSYCYWYGDGYPVRYRCGAVTDPDVVGLDPREAAVRAGVGERGLVDWDGATWHPNFPTGDEEPPQTPWWRRLLRARR